MNAKTILFGLITAYSSFSATCSIWLLIPLSLNITMFVFGITRKNECPLEPKVPLYLIVAGSVGLLPKLLPIINRKLNSNFIEALVFLLQFFEFVWVILGSVWIYNIYPPNYDSSVGPYCNKTVYLFGFCFLTISWILVGIIIISIFLLCCCGVKYPN